MLKNYMPKETSHGNITFPLSVYKSSTNFDECILYSHWHDEVEFFYLASGNATFFIDNKTVEINSGEVIFINSGEIHSAYSKNFSECKFYAIVFDLNMLMSNKIGECQNKYLYPLIHKYYEMPQKFSYTSKWEITILEKSKIIINNYINSVPGYEIIIIACLYTIISELIINDKLYTRNNTISKQSSYKLEQLKKALTFIHSNYNKKISMLDIAKEVNMSQYHFCRFFKTMSGCTPFEYLISYRINSAEKLLNDTDKTITTIAYEVGFDTVSYFIKTFKKIKKNTPAQFREAYGN